MVKVSGSEAEPEFKATQRWRCPKGHEEGRMAIWPGRDPQPEYCRLCVQEWLAEKFPVTEVGVPR